MFSVHLTQCMTVSLVSARHQSPAAVQEWLQKTHRPVVIKPQGTGCGHGIEVGKLWGTQDGDAIRKQGGQEGGSGGSGGQGRSRKFELTASHTHANACLWRSGARCQYEPGLLLWIGSQVCMLPFVIPGQLHYTCMGSAKKGQRWGRKLSA